MTEPIWRKSTFSAGGNNCVELAEVGTAVLVRDSKHPDGGHLTLTRDGLAALVLQARVGELDHLSG